MNDQERKELASYRLQIDTYDWQISLRDSYIKIMP